MAAGKRTPPEVEAQVVDLVKAGRSRREVSEATGVSVRVVTRIVHDAPGVEFAMIGAGSNGTPEGMAKARSYRSEYMRNRREAVAERLLDETERTLDLAARETDPRKRQALMQAADASMRAYSNVTKGDILVSDQERMQGALSMLDKLSVQLTAHADTMPPPREGLIQE